MAGVELNLRTDEILNKIFNRTAYEAGETLRTDQLLNMVFDSDSDALKVNVLGKTTGGTFSNNVLTLKRDDNNDDIIITGFTSGGTTDLSNYYTKTETNAAITNASIVVADLKNGNILTFGNRDNTPIVTTGAVSSYIANGIYFLHTIPIANKNLYPGVTITITNSAENNGTYTVQSITSSVGNVEWIINTVEAIPNSALTDGNFSLSQASAYPVEGDFFETDFAFDSYANEYAIGDIIRMSGTVANNGIYTIKGIDFTGDEYENVLITVNENITDLEETSGTYTIIKYLAANDVITTKIEFNQAALTAATGSTIVILPAIIDKFYNIISAKVRFVGTPTDAGIAIEIKTDWSGSTEVVLSLAAFTDVTPACVQFLHSNVIGNLYAENMGYVLNIVNEDLTGISTDSKLTIYLTYTVESL